MASMISIIIMSEQQPTQVQATTTAQQVQLKEPETLSTEAAVSKQSNQIPQATCTDFQSQQQQAGQWSKPSEQQPYPQAKVQQLKVNEEDLSDTEIQKYSEDNPQKATLQKNKGNELFREGKFTEAIIEYQQGLKYTEDKSMRATLFSNIAVCFIKEEDYAYAKKYCKKVLGEDENHRKGRMNLARCYEEDKKIEEAYEEYQKVEKNLEGASSQDIKFVKDKIAYLKPKIDQLNESRKKQVVEGLKNIGNSILGYFGMSLDNFKLEQGAGGGYNISFKQ